MSLDGLPKYIDLTEKPSPYHILTAHLGDGMARTILSELNAYGFVIALTGTPSREPTGKYKIVPADDSEKK